MQCERCKKEFQGENWQKVCKTCYAAAKNIQQPKINENQGSDREKSIIRQVCFKCAAQVMPHGSSALDVIIFAKRLEEGFYK